MDFRGTLKNRDESFSPTLSLNFSGGPTSYSRNKHWLSGEAGEPGIPQPHLQPPYW